MSGVNKVILVGHLGRDPDIRTFPNGDRVANLSVATSESWRDKVSGERRERTEWHRVVILNQPLVEVAERFLKKGSKLYVEGQLAARKFEREGREAYVTEIVLRPFRGEIALLDKADGGVPKGDADDYNRADPPRTSAGPTTSSQDMDDEIPF